MQQWPEREKLSKKIVTSAEPQVGQWANAGCFSGGRVFIYIWAKYQPIQVFWDQSAFDQDVCRAASFLSDHQVDELGGPIDLNNFPERYRCMAIQNQAGFDVSAAFLEAEPYQARIFLEKEVEGLGISTVYGLRFAPAIQEAYTPCYWITDTEATTSSIKQLALFPNPTRNQISVGLPENETILQMYLTNGVGKTIPLPKRQASTIEVSHLTKGVYQLIVQSKSGENYVGRFVKL